MAISHTGSDLSFQVNFSHKGLQDTVRGLKARLQGFDYVYFVT
jgi:hypothetical protein